MLFKLVACCIAMTFFNDILMFISRFEWCLPLSGSIPDIIRVTGSQYRPGRYLALRHQYHPPLLLGADNLTFSGYQAPGFQKLHRKCLVSFTYSVHYFSATFEVFWNTLCLTFRLGNSYKNSTENFTYFEFSQVFIFK